MGLHRAWPDALIIGVDVEPQPHYPFTFVQADALHPPFDLAEFDFIWASPPCQAYSMMQHMHKNREAHPDLIDPTRKMLDASGRPYVIENVEGAPLKAHLMLCGTMFGLKVSRHRYFESNAMPFALLPPCDHRELYDRFHGGEMARGEREKHSAANGIDWFMTREEVRNAIPPAYSEYIARQIRAVNGTAAT